MTRLADNGAGAWVRRLVVAGMAALAPALAAAQMPADALPFPSRTVRLIVPYPPGAAADAVARAVADKLAQSWNQRVVVENRPGLTAGTLAARHAPPDGYTLLLGTAATMVTTPLTMKRPSYDAQRDFTPISRLVAVTPVLVVQPSLGIGTLPELVAHVRRHPGRYAYASSGNGGPSYLAMEQLCAVTGMAVLHVGYKGAAQSLTDLVSGQVNMGFYALPSALPFIRAGQVTAIGVAAPKRQAALPDVPTVAESIPGFHYMLWYGLFAPAGTPAPVVARIGADIHRILKAPDIVGLLAAQGSQAAASSPEELARQIQEETLAWKAIIRERGIVVH